MIKEVYHELYQIIRDRSKNDTAMIPKVNTWLLIKHSREINKQYKRRTFCDYKSIHYEDHHLYQR